MKATLQILLLLLGACAAFAAFVGLIGVQSSLAFLTSETAMWIYPVAGLMLIGFTDYSRRPALTVAPARACPTSNSPRGRRANVYGLRRRTCVTA
ncbi:MAG TPA: hypothetical protein VMF63_11150 [Opitutaceae bacterium]|nr:hypothetical protein [Opitutaceae bacterium]